MMRTIGDTTLWHAHKGDYTHRLDYDLNEKSIVIDLGGHEGWFTEQINNKYHSKIYCFEPILTFSNQIQNKFKNYENIKVYPLAISNKNGKDFIYFNENSSSIHVKNNNVIEIKCITFDKMMEENNIEFIDLLKINIEGEEYPLLEDMILKNLLTKCMNIQVQFHTIIDNYELRYDYIKYQLIKTHHLTYEYPYVWENWKLNKI